MQREITLVDIQSYTSELQFQIGIGGSSRVYRGNIPVGNRYGLTPQSVAVKLSDIGKAALFDREIQMMNWEEQAHVAHLIGFCSHEDRRYIVTPFIGGGTLTDAYTELTWEAVLKIADGIADGIQFFHNDNRVIVDLKPDNVLLKQDLTPVLCDFGSLAPVDSDIEEIACTLCYLDPFAYERGSVQKDQDVYAFGLILLQLLMRQEVIATKKDKPTELENIQAPALRMYETDGHVLHRGLLSSGCSRSDAVAVTRLALSLVLHPAELRGTLGIQLPLSDVAYRRPDIEFVREQLETLTVRASGLWRACSCIR